MTRERETDDLTPPREGMSTLAAQYTRRSVEHILKVIQTLRHKGKSEEAIRERMQQELRQFSPFSLERLYQKSIGRAIPDDFKQENIAQLEAVKSNTIRVTVHQLPGEVQVDDLVLYRGEDWYVSWIEGKTYTLKQVQ